MKKILSLGLLMLLSASCLFGQSLESKKLFLGINDFIKVNSAAWKTYDGELISADTINEEYSFAGSFIIKVLMTNSRYDYVCSVKNDGDISVAITDMVSYACDKNGKIIKTSNVINTAAKVSSQYAEQIKTEIKARIAKISDDSVDAAYTKLVTSPAVIRAMSKVMTDLALKKFIETNINGKEVELDVVLSSIDENKKSEFYPLNYKLDAYVPDVYSSEWGRFMEKRSFNVRIYSNNDKLLSTKKGSVYKAKGILKLKHVSEGANISMLEGFWVYEISEN